MITVLVLRYSLYVLMVALLAGCAGAGGGPGMSGLANLSCRGKAAITGTGQLTGTASWIGGAAGNSWSAQFDCGEGFELKTTPQASSTKK